MANHLFLFILVLIVPERIAGLQIVCMAQQQHLIWQLLHGGKETQPVPLPHLAENHAIWRIVPHIFLPEADPYLVLDEYWVTQIRIRI